jgi:protein-disulfide isomerase
VKVVFKHNPLPMHPNAPLAHEAAVEAGRQGKFWEMHDLLFANQWLDRASLVSNAQQLGLDVRTFTRALDDRTHRGVVERDMAEARALGLNSTPTLLVNGRRMVGVPKAAALVATIRSILSGGTGAVTGDVAPDSFDLAGAPARGAADAPVTIVEFSDFQCGFCARASGTISRLLEEFPGKIRWVFKNYPLDFHQDAPRAHRAALAAHEQGKFWEMHDLIFANQRAIGQDDLLKHAAALKLDADRMARDMSGTAAQTLIDRDLAEGSKVGVDGTPTFFVNGKRIVGAARYETMAEAVRLALGAASARTVEGIQELMSYGPPDARVTIRWFGDLTSPLHRDAIALVRRVVDAHREDVRVVFRHLPSASRDYSRLLHEAAVSAAEQGLFWAFHDVLVKRGPGESRESLARLAARLGLDSNQFLEALDSGRGKDIVERHLSEARRLDVRGTPTFFVNDRRIDGLMEAGELIRIVEEELKTSGN